MGTLSGGGTERVSIGERCLLGAESGLGIALGDDCVIEAGLYVTAGTKVTLPDGTVTKASEALRPVEPALPAQLGHRHRRGPAARRPRHRPQLRAPRQRLMGSSRRALTLAEERPRRGPARWVARGLVLALVALVGLGAWFGGKSLFQNVLGTRCQATAAGNSVDFDPEQMSNAATITAIALRRGLPARAATIALATAIQESKARNIRYGDRDSVGLFQQRPSQGWGTVEQILDPEYTTNKFYDALVKVKGWETGTITVVAQKVQRSAYPEAYADHEQEGRILASSLAGHSPRGVGCRLDDPEGEADVALIGRLLDAEYKAHRERRRRWQAHRPGPERPDGLVGRLVVGRQGRRHRHHRRDHRRPDVDPQPGLVGLGVAHRQHPGGRAGGRAPPLLRPCPVRARRGFAPSPS